MKAFSAAACVGLAAWCSLGALGMAEGARVALLPPWWLLPVAAAAACAGVRWLRFSSSQLNPLFGSALVIVPFLPLPLPPAALLWTGPFAAGVWICVAIGVVGARRRPARSRWLTDVRRAPIVAAALALAVYGATAWWLSPVLPDGDAPHYLVLARSLIEDGDLRIEDNHRRGEDLAFSLFAAQPHYQRRGVDGAIYSIHAPGVPVLVAPALMLYGYPGVVAFLALVSALSTGFVWRLGHHVTASAGAAWFGWASCALTAPFVFQATQVFPDGIGAVFLLVGMLPLIGARGGNPIGGHAVWLGSGVALAVLPWLQTRLVVAAAMAGVCIGLHLRTARQLALFAIVPAISAAAWFGYFNAIYGTFDPAAPYGSAGENTQTSLAHLVSGFPGLLFDQQFGLIPNAPVFGLILVGLLVGAFRLKRGSVELLAVLIPYLIAVGMFRIWYGGTSSPARLLAPFSLVLGVAAARVWSEARTPATRGVGLVSLVASVMVAAVLLGPDRGRLLLNFRDGVALWLEWANDLVDLPRGMPSLFREGPGLAWLKAAIWAVSLGAGWLAARAIDARTRRTGGGQLPLLSWQTTFCLAMSVMAALTLSWRAGSVEALTPATAELGLLREASAFRPTVYTYGDGRFKHSAEIVPRLRVRTDRQRRQVPDGAWLFASRVPRGTYDVHLLSGAPANGALALRVGTTPLPVWRASVSDGRIDAAAPPLRLAVDVESIAVEGSGDADRAIDVVELRPVAGGPTSPAARGNAHRAVRYESAVAYFLDDNAYAEPGGFWVAGARAARVVIAPRLELAGSEAAEPRLYLRNAPVDNVIAVEVGGARHELTLQAREEVMLALPGGAGARDLLLRIETQAGVRAQFDSADGDLRYLGCWLEIR